MLIKWNIEKTGITKKSKKGKILHQCALTIYNLDKMLQYFYKINIKGNYSIYEKMIEINKNNDFELNISRFKLDMNNPYYSTLYKPQIVLKLPSKNLFNKHRQILFLTDYELSLVVKFFRAIKKYKFSKKEYMEVFSKQEQNISKLKEELSKQKKLIKKYNASITVKKNLKEILKLLGLS